jgi:hypothetical protein
LKSYRYGAVAALALLSTQSPAFAASDKDLDALRAEVAAMRQQYDAKIADLETRLKAAEAAAPAETTATAEAPAADDGGPPPVDENPIESASNDAPVSAAAAAPTAAANAFNPGVSVVLNGLYVAASRDPAAHIPGFQAGDGVGQAPRGFSAGESELTFAANIDPYLTGFLDFSIGADNDVSLEEAYIRTTSLPGGFTLKAGRFLSGIGYMNEGHAHNWSFSDAPLPYRAFLNNQYGDDGVQVRWLAPIDRYLEFGAEAFRGEAYPAAGAANSGQGTFTAFVRTGSDINTSSSYLVAASYLHSRADGRENPEGTELFTGSSDLGMLSLVYKWAPNGNPINRNFNLVSELFFGRDEGRLNGAPFSQSHFGWYAQGVYQFMPQWSAGLRIAGVQSEDAGPLLVGTSLDDEGRSPYAVTALLERDTSEFGRLRLQYTRDEIEQQANNIFTLQYTVIYGPHGAHRY